MAGDGEGVRGATVALGGAGTGVAEGVGAAVGGTAEGDAVGDATLASGVLDAAALGLADGVLTAALGLADGVAQAATRTRIESVARS